MDVTRRRLLRLAAAAAALPGAAEFLSPWLQAQATGYRYWTISVSNLSELVQQCEAAGVTVAVPITELRPGITIAIVEDPDGNWVELLESAS